MKSSLKTESYTFFVEQEMREFQASCERHYICYAMAGYGVDEVAKIFNSRSVKPNKRLSAGTKLPKVTDNANLQPSITFEELFSCQKSGKFRELIARSLVIDIYTEWEEVRRKKIAKICGVEKNNVNADLMGDVRNIRNFLVHKKWKDKKLKVLRWAIGQESFRVTGNMFEELVQKIKLMKVVVLK